MVRSSMTKSMRRWTGAGILGLLICGATAGAEEPAPLREPKPLSGAVESLLADATAQDVVRERYPNRKVKIERHVAQDADGNFVNHGTWAMWDEQGREMGTGEYQQGKRAGIWTRTFLPGELELLSGPLGQQFTGPFTSTATFENDMLQGQWTVVDSQGRTALVWGFRENHRHGRCVWNYPNGEPWREVEYVDGEPHGKFTEWAPSGEVTSAEKFIHGCRELVQNEFYSPGVKKTEAQFLMAKELTEVTIDWWHGVYRIKVIGYDGKDQRHGPWATWHPNGQIAAQGQYRQDAAEGKFVFWHENGQKSIEGNYDGGRQAGQWTWWHENGLKSIVGIFERGEQIGSWSRWQADGKLIESSTCPEPVRSIANKVVPDQQVSSTAKQNEPTLAPLRLKPSEPPAPPSEAAVVSQPAADKPPAASQPAAGKPAADKVPAVASRPARVDEPTLAPPRTPPSSRNTKNAATKVR